MTSKNLTISLVNVCARSTAQRVRQRMEEFAGHRDLAVLRKELELPGVDAMGSGTSRGCDSSVQHRAFINQREQRNPGRQIKERDHVERVARAPRRAVPRMRADLETKGLERPLNRTVFAPHARQHVA